MRYSSVLAPLRPALARFADRVALRCGPRRVTYARLDAGSARLAGVLRAAGAAPGSVVAILADDPVQAVVAVVGCLRAGCAFAPLDGRTPPARLAGMLSAAQPAVLLVEAALVERVAALPAGAAPGTVFAIGGGGEAGGVPHADAAPCEGGFEGTDPDPDGLCYLYFTSGSTGEPKAIAGRHRALHHFVAWETGAFGVGEGTRVSQLTTPSFDAFLRDVFVPLCAGGTICAPERREALADPAALVEWIDGEKIQLLHCVPSVFRRVLDGEPGPERFVALRHVLMAGEPLLPVDVRRWTERMGDRVRLVNLYGPSETTMVKLFYPVDPADGERPFIPIGRPMPGAAAVVVDGAGRVCPPGRVGEILIRTPYRSLGYYRRPDLTARVFVPNPFGGDPADLVYRTGDFGRVLDDGNFQFLGRRDHQVKVNGVRVELGEVEEALRSHPAVRDVAVVDVPDGRGSAYLCAYLAARGELDPESLRPFLLQRLPPPLVPAVFVSLQALPRTLSGKVDRAALPPPAPLTGGAAPRTEDEAVLLRLWRELLGVEAVGMHDSFFAAGGQSLLAARLCVRVRDALGVELPVRAVFEAPTIAGLAERVARARGEAAPAASHPIPRAERGGPLPVSDAQRRLWFLERLRPGTHGYNLGSAHRLRGRLDADALERAVATVVRRHESLRTRFAEVDDEPVQVVDDGSSIRLVRLSVDESDVARVATEEAERPFDLERGPLFRATLLRVGDDDHVLLLSLHHMVFDGWSVGVLYREVAALYAAELRGESAGLPALEIQYADYAAWQRSALSGERLDALLAYWRSALGDAPRVLELHVDHPRPPMQSYCGGRVQVRVPAEVADGLRAIARAEGATLYMVLLAAFQLLLSRYAQQDQVLVGTPVANRSRAELEGLIGFFAGTLVLRGDLRGAPSFRELLGRVREQTLGAYAHQELPFERLVEALEVERDLGRNPLFQVMFALQNAPGEGLRLQGVRAERLAVDRTSARFDLTLALVEEGGGISGWLEYSADVFERATAERMAEHLGVLLRAAAAAPSARAADLPLMTDGERRRVVEACNAVEGEPAWDGCIHEVFADQARRTPDALAVIAGDARISYAELDARANALAWGLRARGVGVEARVGVLLERGAELVAALLGVLKAGGCYVPLDPEHPAERLRWILADADVRVVVSTAELAPRLGDDAREVVRIEDADAAAPSAAPESGLESGAAPESLAYVIYTSGSTGRPKGVMVPHRAVLRLVRGTDYAPLGPDDRVAHAATPAFDAATWEIWGPLLNGGATAVVPRDVALSPPALGAFLRERGVTALFLTTALFNQTAREAPDTFRPLRHLLFGGERVDVPSVRAVVRAGAPRRLLHVYGPTESTTFATWHPVSAADAEGHTIPIGRPVARTTAYVLDPRGHPCPAGVPGELHLGGAGVARGYLGRPALTAGRFVPDPFGAPGGRLYRTGDRVRRLADGALEFLGRTDFQVKLRGFRVEPAEVAQALRGHPAVRDALVTAEADGAGERRLVAYVAADRGTASPAALREHLRRALPEYMVPAAFVVLDALPLTANGKVDRAALPPPDVRESARHVPPRTPLEARLAGIWSEVLGVERVGVHDDFFASGGHSLRAMQVVSRIRRALGCELPVRALFECPTIEALAPVVEAAQRGAPADEAPLPRLRRDFRPAADLPGGA